MIPNQMQAKDSENKELYVAPNVEIIEIKVEKGFAASPVSDGSFNNDSWGTGTW